MGAILMGIGPHATPRGTHPPTSERRGDGGTLGAVGDGGTIGAVGDGDDFSAIGADPPPFFLVWPSAPGFIPHRHATASDAEAHAVRLADAFPGQIFYVLAPVCGVQRSHAIFERRYGDQIRPR